MGPKPASLVDRLLAWKSNMPNPTGCWLPITYVLLKRKGNIYFKITYRGKKELIHRLSAIAFLDLSEDSELQVNHKPICPHKCCFNPEHIYAGTAKDNSQDYSRSKTHCKHGHEMIPSNVQVVILRSGSRKGQVIRNCRECSKLNARRRRSVKDKLKELILKYLNLYNGSSPGYIVSKVMSELGPTAFTNEEFHEAYEELLDSKEMLTLEFEDYTGSTRSKTILFSKGTNFLNLGVFGLKGIADGQRSAASQTDVARTSD